MTDELDPKKPENEAHIETPEDEDDVVEFVFTADGEEDLKATLKKLRKDLKDARAEKMDYLTQLQRERADFQNFKKAESDRISQMGGYVREKMTEDLLPVLDAYDMAFANKEAWEKVEKNWRMGVEYIHQQLIKVLNDNGIDEISTKEGDTFDPVLHEPMENIETEDASLDHKIAKVIQKGYKAKDKILRPARVGIYSKKA
jgi:molecular chaperone GrpE